jgi:hypothetical protein
MVIMQTCMMTIKVLQVDWSFGFVVIHRYQRPILHPKGLAGQRAGFIYSPVWVTPKAAGGGNADFWPCGEFMNWCTFPPSYSRYYI